MLDIADTTEDRATGAEADRLRVRMLTYQGLGGSGAAGAGVLRERLAEHPACAEELAQLADVLMARSRVDLVPIPGAEDLPLHLHAAYHVREVPGAVGFLTEDRCACGPVHLRDPAAMAAGSAREVPPYRDRAVPLSTPADPVQPTMAVLTRLPS
jgi:hypothetical protein